MTDTIEQAIQNSMIRSCKKQKGIFRVLHTADWHLGKILHDSDRIEEHQRFLNFLLTLIEYEEIDLLLISGDIFDSAHPPKSAERQYFEFLADIHKKTNCSVIITAGNHDSPTHLEAPQQVLRALDVHIIGTIPKDLENALIALPSREDPSLVVAAVPYLRDSDLRTGYFGQAEDEIRRDLQEGIRNCYAKVGSLVEECYPNGPALLCMGHLTILGASRSESERDIQIGGLGAVRADVFPPSFSYVALGHLHHPQKVGSQEHLRYSGSPIPLSFSEADDDKEVRVLDFFKGKLIGNRAVKIPISRRLVQLRVSGTDLVSKLSEFVPPASDLIPWIELIVDVNSANEDLLQIVQKLTEGKAYKVVKIISQKVANLSGLTSGEEFNNEEFSNLLDDPLEVFNCRLDREIELSENEKDKLRTVFSELYDLVLERKRDNLTDIGQGNKL